MIRIKFGTSELTTFTHTAHQPLALDLSDTSNYLYDKEVIESEHIK